MSRFAVRLPVAFAAVVCLAMTACEDPGFGEVTYRNDTDRRIAMVVTLDGDLEAQLARPVGFPLTHEPGSSWLHTYPPATSGDRWCEPGVTYYFVAPKDASVVSTGGQADDPQLGIGEVDVIDTLSMPCWPGEVSDYTID